MELKEVLYWIVDNSDDKNAMDKISNFTFPFTTKYENFIGKGVERDELGHIIK